MKYCSHYSLIPIALLPPFVRSIQVTIIPLGREEGWSLAAFYSIFVLVQERLFAIFVLLRR